MALEMNIDNRKLNRIFKDNPGAFGFSPDAFKIVNLRSDIADYIFEVRTEITMSHEGLSREDAETKVQTQLDATKSKDIL